jgi:hypothetical protein
MRFGRGILPSLIITSNKLGEIPTKAAASARDKPRGGSDRGSTSLEFLVAPGAKLVVPVGENSRVECIAPHLPSHRRS